MDAGLDTGDILTQAATPIAPEDNAQTLHDRLAAMGARLLVQTLPDYVAGRVASRPQPAQGASYARKIAKADGCLDWTQPARVLWNRVRAFTPWPGAFTHQSRGETKLLLKIGLAEVLDVAGGAPGEILRAGNEGIVVACGAGALRILELQREGGRRLAAREFLAGHPLKPGERLV